MSTIFHVKDQTWANRIKARKFEVGPTRNIINIEYLKSSGPKLNLVEHHTSLSCDSHEV